VWFKPSRAGGTPVTLTLYHLVRLGGHSSLAVILLFGPSLMEVSLEFSKKFHVE
jgi:hypothetical protein